MRTEQAVRCPQVLQTKRGHQTTPGKGKEDERKCKESENFAGKRNASNVCAFEYRSKCPFKCIALHPPHARKQAGRKK